AQPTFEIMSGLLQAHRAAVLVYGRAESGTELPLHGAGAHSEPAADFADLRRRRRRLLQLGIQESPNAKQPSLVPGLQCGCRMVDDRSMLGGERLVNQFECAAGQANPLQLVGLAPRSLQELFGQSLGVRGWLPGTQANGFSGLPGVPVSVGPPTMRAQPFRCQMNG